MSLETDLLLDRRRLKRRLASWRVVGVLAVLACVLIGLGRVGMGNAGLGAVGLARPHVARLSVTGIITDDRKLVERVTALAGDPSVHAVIVDIDSPGGSVAGGESLHDALVAVAAKKPVVTVMRGVAASAGYMIAVPSARIFAREATLTGSIGVILQTGEVSGLLGKLGVSAEAITSGPLKDQPSLTRPLTDQGREVLHGLVMDLYEQFVGMVATGRRLDPARVRALGDGRAYTGRQALGLGLVDEIGSEPAARIWLAEQRGVAADLPVEDVERRTLAERTLGASLGGLLQDGAKTLLGQSVTLDGAVSLWQPFAMAP